MKDRAPIQKANTSVRGGAGAPALASSNHYYFQGDSKPYPNSANNTIKIVTLPLFVLLFIFLFLPYTTSTPVCDPLVSCGLGSSYIVFPFWLRDKNPGQRCGYPGFELSCDNDWPSLNIPNAGNFVVTSTSSVNVFIDDPGGCFPKRFLMNNISLAGTPFKWSADYVLVNLTFLICPNLMYPLDVVRCLSNIYNSDVVVLSPSTYYEKEWISSCELISSAWIPMSDSRPWLFSDDLYSEIKLEWNQPNCTKCDAYYEQCGFLGDTGLNVTCYNTSVYVTNEDHYSSETRFRMAFGIAIAVTICFTVVPCLLCGRSKLEMHRQQPQASIELPTSNIAQLPVVAVAVAGVELDRSIIGTYPKIEVSGSGALPDPNHNICSICLCEYKPKDTLRCIPNCNHFFHLNCLDEWLKMNSTCPLCRNLPGRSSSVFSTT